MCEAVISERAVIYQNVVLQKVLERILHKGDCFFMGLLGTTVVLYLSNTFFKVLANVNNFNLLIFLQGK